jgi:hypothetical protein
MAEETWALAADPQLAMLRRLLSQARAMGVPFDVAWSAARRAVLAGLTAHEHQDYRLALRATREAWQAAYEGQPSSRLDRLVVWLEAWVQDGELPPMATDDHAAQVMVSPPTLAQRQAIAVRAEAAGVRY